MKKKHKRPGRPRLSEDQKKKIQRVAVDKSTYHNIKSISIRENKKIMDVIDDAIVCLESNG